MHIFVFSLLLFASQIAFAGVDGALVSLAPPSSTLLTGINVQQAVHSPSGSTMLRQIMEGQGLVKIIADVGLDVHRDISQILLVGIGQQLRPDSRYAVVARGTYNPTRLIAAGQLRGASVRRFGVVSMIVQRNGNAASAIAFARPGVLVMGDVAKVESILAPGADHGDIDPTLRGEVDQIAPANDVWYATTLSGSFLSRQVGNSLPSALRNSGALDRISRSSGGLHFGADDTVTLVLVANSPGDARLISGVLRVAGKLAHLNLGGKPDLVLAESILSSMRVAVNGTNVHANSAVSDEQLERALNSAK